MNVGPLKPGGVPPQTQSRTGPERTDDALPAQPSIENSRRADSHAPVSADHVELSNAARELQPIGTGAGARAHMDSARMREVLGRVNSGWYDRADVREVVVGRLSGDLGAAGNA